MHSAITIPANAVNVWSKRLSRPVTWETLTIAGICFVDMAWTILAIELGLARESNPIIGSLLKFGVIWFAVGKMLSFLLPLTGLEILRERIPLFVQTSMRFGLFAYVMVYIVGSLHVHGML